MASHLGPYLAEHWPSKGQALSNYSSGALAGLSLEAATHAASVLYMRQLQLRAGHPLGKLGFQWWAAAIRSPTRPKGPYQGAVGTLAAGSIWSGIFGSCYVPIKAAVDEVAGPDQPHWGPFVAAATASVAASSVRVPKQVVKARIEQHEFFCSLQAFERILVKEGVLSLYKGWGRSVAKNMPFDAALFVLYEASKQRLLDSTRQPHLRAHEALALGAASGFAAGLATSPFELVKLLRQAPAAAATVIGQPCSMSQQQGMCSSGSTAAAGECAAEAGRLCKGSSSSTGGGPASSSTLRSRSAYHSLSMDLLAEASTPAQSTARPWHRLKSMFSACRQQLSRGTSGPQWSQHGAMLRGRLALTTFEAAVFFPSLELAIRLCDWLEVENFVSPHDDPPAEQQSAAQPW